jgi:hypothetical protein
VKHFLVTIRKADDKKSVLIVPAERQSDITKVLKEKNISLVEIKTIEMNNPLKEVVVKCGWGKDSHPWATFKWNAITHRNTCEDCRAKKGEA